MNAYKVQSEPGPIEEDRVHFFDPICKLYEQAGPDYAYWSKAFQMHFGYYRWGMNPFRLEPMLEEMNRQVWKGLSLAPSESPHILDLGCGLGAVARQFARQESNLQISGFTIVPWQVAQATQKNREEALDKQVRIYWGDFTQIPLASRSVDGAYAIESACYASGAGKRDFVRECARVLKPGASLVVADGFMKRRPPKRGIVAFLYQKVCANWALPGFAEIDTFGNCLQEEGFEVRKIRDISWQVAPSAAYIPRTCIRFLWDHFLGKKSQEKTSVEAFQNAWASVLGGMLGLFRSYFGYYLVEARKI